MATDTAQAATSSTQVNTARRQPDSDATEPSQVWRVSVWTCNLDHLPPQKNIPDRLRTLIGRSRRTKAGERVCADHAIYIPSKGCSLCAIVGRAHPLVRDDALMVVGMALYRHDMDFDTWQNNGTVSKSLAQDLDVACRRVNAALAGWHDVSA